MFLAHIDALLLIFSPIQAVPNLSSHLGLNYRLGDITLCSTTNGMSKRFDIGESFNEGDLLRSNCIKLFETKTWKLMLFFVPILLVRIKNFKIRIDASLLVLFMISFWILTESSSIIFRFGWLWSPFDKITWLIIRKRRYL